MDSKTAPSSKVVVRSAGFLTWYKEWVVGNKSWYLQILEFARSMVLFFPGKFNDDVSVEALHAVLNLLSMYHNKILRETDDEAPNAQTPNDAVKYKIHADARNIWTDIAENTLSFFQCSEILLEILAIKYIAGKAKSRYGKWMAILGIEAVKSSAKLFLLKQNQGQMLQKPSVVNEMDERVRMQGDRFLQKVSDQQIEHPHADVLTMYAKHGRTFLPNGSFFPRPVHAREEKTFRPSLAELLGEVLHHVRPVIYVLTRVLVKQQSKWTPFLVSLFTDIVAKACSFTNKSPLSEGEQAERANRVFQLSYYLIRDPFFGTNMLGPIQFLTGLLAKIPVLGYFLTMISELLVQLQAYHFYQSA